MRYEGDIYRPPSEARSYLLQVTIGCSHNQCTFCSMFKNKRFRVRAMDEIFEDLEMARDTYGPVEKIFLCDGDALCLATEKLLKILAKIKDCFPSCGSVNVYGSPKDVLAKSPEDLVRLKEAGLKMVYLGGESGSDVILERIHKGATAAEIIEAIKKIETSGLKASVTFISGLGGRAHWREHAIKTGEMISAGQPSYVGLLTLMVERGTPIAEEIQEGTMEILTAEEVADETLLLLEHTQVTKECVFRSNHASNYVSLRGTLPQDRQAMMDQLIRAKEQQNSFKDERLRML